MAHCAFQFGRIVCMVEEEEEEEFDIAEHRIVKPYQFEPIIGQPVSLSEYSASEDEESGEQNSEEEGESDLSDSEPETTGEETEFDGDVDLDGAENQDGPTTPPRRKRKRSDQSHRIGNTNWCTCGHCLPMQTAKESVCCNEMEQVAEKLDEKGNCIIDHEGFQVNCLNEHVLETSFWEFL
ncbi:uncharacterized protein LOC143036648 [Oratosquilla oratoria]|uniref:uncharacterized protein LOC143036648 n=1 Tax=Oratosquilla oratoria TaxID=337810 RepID=UPI003F76C1B3